MRKKTKPIKGQLADKREARICHSCKQWKKPAFVLLKWQVVVAAYCAECAHQYEDSEHGNQDGDGQD